jgi:hypothetical protein
MLCCWWHPFSNNLNCWQWVSAFTVAFFATPARQSFLVKEDCQPAFENKLSCSNLLQFFVLSLFRPVVLFATSWFGGMIILFPHTSIDTTLAELVQALLHQPDCDE